MRRLSSALVVVALAATGLLVPVAPANAATTVTASASPRTLSRGDTTRIVGYARGAAPGSTVSLQLKTGDAWQSLRERTTDASGAYSFTVKPPKGHPVYRVVLPRQGGRPFAASDPVTLTVRWTLDLTIAAEWRNTAAGGRWLVVSGTTSYSGAGRVRLQQKFPDTGWGNRGFLGLDHGTFSGTPRSPVRPGLPLRVVLGASGPRLEAVSTPLVVPSPDPYHLTLNDPAGLTLPSRQTLTTVLIDAEAGDLVTLWFDGWLTEWPAVVDPDGVSVPTSTAPARFEAAKTGTYSATFWVMGSTAGGPATVYAFTQKTYAAEWGVPIDVEPDFPYQPIDVVYPGTAGQLFATPAAGYVPEVLDAAGPLAPWHTVDLRRVYRVVADGPITYRILDGNSHRVLLGRALEETATIDGPEVPLDLSNGTTLAVVSYDVSAGQAHLAAPDNNNAQVTARLLDPDGAVTSWHQADPDPGTYRVVLFADSCPSCSVGVSSPLLVETPLGDPPVAISSEGPPVRWIWQTFTASAGDLVSTYVDNTAGFTTSGELYGPDGQPAPSEGPMWRIPASGTWQLRFDAIEWAGHLSAGHVPVTTLPADGSTTTITLAQPSDVRLVHVDVPVGSTVRLTVDQVDASLADGWFIRARALDGSVYGVFSTPVLLAPVTVTQPGGLDLVVSGRQGTTASGSLRLAVTSP